MTGVPGRLLSRCHWLGIKAVMTVFARALENGSFSPRNENDKYFLKVCRGEALPRTAFQKVYLKYIIIRDYSKTVERERRKNKIIKEMTLNVMKIEGDIKSKGDNGLKQNEDIDFQKRKEISEALISLAKRMGVIIQN